MVLTIVHRLGYVLAALAGRCGRLLVLLGVRLVLAAAAGCSGAAKFGARWASEWHIRTMDYRQCSRRRRLLVGWEYRGNGSTSSSGRACWVLCVSTGGTTCRLDPWSCICAGELSEEESGEGVGDGDERSR